MDFHLIYANLNIPVVVVDFSDKHVLYMNAQAKIMLDIDGCDESLSISNVLRCKNPDSIQNMMETIKENETIQNYHLTLEDEVLLEITGNIISEGVLILYIREVTESEKTVSYNSVFRYVFGVTFSLHDIDEIINLILKAATLSTHSSCSFIFREYEHLQHQYTHEWCNIDMKASHSCKDINITQSSYMTLLKNNDSVVFNDLNEIDPVDAEAFRPANVKAAALFPLFVSSKYYGFMGFADCNTYRKWTTNDLMIFYDTANLISEVFARRQMEILIADSQKIISNVLDNINSNIYVIDFETDELLFINKHAINELGISLPFEGKRCWEMIYRRSSKCDYCEKNLLLDDKGNYTGIRKREFLNAKTGKWYYVENSLIKWIDGRTAFMETSIDFNERKIIEEELLYYASTDIMTQTYNRAWGLKLLQEAVDAFQKEGRPVTVCFIDVDGLKSVNDKYGHSEGDILLLTIINAIKNNISCSEHLSRLGGDEFMIVFANSDYRQSEKKLLNVLHELDEYNNSHNKPYACTFCYGLYQIEQNNTMSVDDIISLVDSKMYMQKELHHKRRSARK